MTVAGVRLFGLHAPQRLIGSLEPVASPST
jgi:hypothetical protein